MERKSRKSTFIHAIRHSTVRPDGTVESPPDYTERVEIESVKNNPFDASERMERKITSMETKRCCGGRCK